MPGKVTEVTSSTHFSQLLSQTAYLIVDFYADWCGPCKAISPVFNNLAEKETRPGKLQFCKVDVDSQQDIARKYGVNAMPTFLVLKTSTVVNTVRGANPSALTAAVRSAAAAATGSPAAPGVAFQSKGRTLGSAAQPSAPPDESAFTGLSRLLVGNGGLTDIAVRFVALYLISLFALDAWGAAEGSAFNVKLRK